MEVVFNQDLEDSSANSFPVWNKFLPIGHWNSDNNPILCFHGEPFIDMLTILFQTGPLLEYYLHIYITLSCLKSSIEVLTKVFDSLFDSPGQVPFTYYLKKRKIGWYLHIMGGSNPVPRALLLNHYGMTYERLQESKPNRNRNLRTVYTDRQTKNRNCIGAIQDVWGRTHGKQDFVLVAGLRDPRMVLTENIR